MKWNVLIGTVGLMLLLVGCGQTDEEEVVVTATAVVTETAVVVETEVVVVAATEAVERVEPIPSGRPILSPGEQADGFLNLGGEDEYLVVGLANQPIVGIINPAEGLDLVVELYHDRSGTILVRENSGIGEEYLVFTPNFDGSYAIHVKPAEGLGGYTIQLLDNRLVYLNETTKLEGEARYQVSLKKGTMLTAVVETEPNIDVALKLYDSDGNLVQEVDRFSDYELLYQEVEVDGNYELVVEQLSGQEGLLYRIVVGSSIEE